MIRTMLTLIFCSVASATFAAERPTQPCSPMNYCRAKRSTWTGKRWKEEILKEIRFKSICDGGTEMPSAALAKDLGFELFSYPAREDGKEIERKPHLVLELQGYKRTYLLASAAAPIGTGMLSVSHRLDPKGKAFVEVSCLTK